MTDMTVGASLVIGSKNWQTCTCGQNQVEGCIIHDENIMPVELDEAVAYQILTIHNGILSLAELGGTSPGHAFEEASYECTGKCIAVRRAD